jgi:hypothetical protein
MFAACGGDDDDDAAESPSTSADAQAVDSDVCDANIDLNAALNEVFSAEQPDPEAIKAAYAQGGIAEILDRIEADPPAPIADDIAEGVAAVRKLETGDTSSLESFDSESIDAYFFENCDYVTAEVTAKDYEFDGLPDELDAGAASIKFTNSGKEQHEIAIVRKNDGVTESFDELLQLPEDQADTKVTFATATGAEPGGTSYATGTLEPGEYIAVCFIPQGTTGDTEGSGPPHAMLGMKHEFTVS